MPVFPSRSFRARSPSLMRSCPPVCSASNHSLRTRARSATRSADEATALVVGRARVARALEAEVLKGAIEEEHGLPFLVVEARVRNSLSAVLSEADGLTDDSLEKLDREQAKISLVRSQLESALAAIDAERAELRDAPS